MGDAVEWVGFWAAVLTTVAFVPQLLRTWRRGGHELSWSMLALFGSGLSLWFIYGLLRGSAPLMLANGLTGVQVFAIAILKLRAQPLVSREGSREGARQSDTKEGHVG